MNQSLNQYYVFYITAQCGNISNAAKKLYISQPAVSKAISRLEEGLSVELFYRNSRGVALTEAGEILYQKLDLAFRAIEAGEEQIQQNEAIGAGRISIGASTTLCKYILLPCLGPFLKENPQIKVSISCQSTYETIGALEAGTLDLGLIGQTERLGNLAFHPVRQISDIFVATRGYLDKLSQDGALKLDDALLEQATLLTLHKDNVTRQYVDQYLLLHNIRIEQLLEVTTMDLLIDFAKLGLGVACVIEDFVQKELEEGSLVRFPTKEPIPPRQIGVALTAQAAKRSAVQKFLPQLLT